MKLRLLNASHSAFAYLGFLAGHEFIYQVAAQPDFVAFMRRFMADEVTPTLAAPPGIDLAAYREALVRRFANPALPHRTQQIAMDGSQKLPQRMLGDRARQPRGRPRRRARARSRSPAGCATSNGEDEHGQRRSTSPIRSPSEFAALAAPASRRSRRDSRRAFSACAQCSTKTCTTSRASPVR